VDARNKVRKEQKNHAEGSERWNMLEAEQKQIKIAANSVYGLLGSIVSPIGDISAAFSVTSWGAKLITEVQSKLQQQFTDAEVVYGDTDSIMILLHGCESVEEGLKRFKQIDAWINKESGILQDPLKMEFEDITFGYVLYGKKHYIKRKYDIKDITKPPELKVAGMQSRAQNPYVTETVDYILDEFLLKEKPEEEIIAYIQERLRRLWAGEVDVSELVHSKNLTKALQEYDNENEQTTAARQRIYDGLPTEPGDRLEYFFCDIVQSRNKKTSDLVVAEHLIDRYPILWSKYAEEFVNEISKILLIRDESKNVVDSLFTRSLDSFTNPMLYEDVRIHTRQVGPPKAIPPCNIHQASSLLGVLVREQRKEAPAPEALKRITVSQDGRAETKRANIHQMPNIGVAMGAERMVSTRVVELVKKRAGKAKEVRGQMSMKDFVAKTTSL
jgi:DNA polymerase elongation subunit (family B)